jgi:UDP-2-acetamido-3-amino-2,3-dideoxy-glucuronate N-acetyltransferase
MAVVGSGYWGKNLVRNSSELGALHTICGQNIATLLAFQEKFPQTRFQTSFEAVLQLKRTPDITLLKPMQGKVHHD